MSLFTTACLELKTKKEAPLLRLLCQMALCVCLCLASSSSTASILTLAAATTAVAAATAPTFFLPPPSILEAQSCFGGGDVRVRRRQPRASCSSTLFQPWENGTIVVVNGSSSSNSRCMPSHIHTMVAAAGSASDKAGRSLWKGPWVRVATKSLPLWSPRISYSSGMP